jgi:hypothetical protein
VALAQVQSPVAASSVALVVLSQAMLKRRKLKLKAKFESGSSHFSFKR